MRINLFKYLVRGAIASSFGMIWIIAIHSFRPWKERPPMSVFRQPRDSDINALQTPVIINNMEQELPVFKEKVEYYRNATQVVYNRVPKCGSTAVHVTIGNLAKVRNFTVHISSLFTEHHASFERQKKSIIQRVKSLQEPWIFDRHVFFVNFTEHGESMPVYINTIRDPMDRISSWYYFIRFQGPHKRPMTAERQMRTYDECVKHDYEECTAVSNFTKYYNYILVPYFCGHDEMCLYQTKQALERAKANVMKHYAVVGIMEDLPNFFIALEYLLPQYFHGALKDYTANYKSLTNSFSTHKKVPASIETREKMKRLLPLEYEFYYFVKQRFYTLVSMINQLKAYNVYRERT